MPDASVVIGITSFYATHFGVPRFWKNAIAAGDKKNEPGSQEQPSPPWMMPAPLAILAGGVLGLIAWAAGCT
jgi:formate hydrogenlyase subunit 3/multisubunit Na+/H+ antiporter MnhD subunit